MKKNHLIAFLLLIVIAACWYAYSAYNEGPRDLKEEGADMDVSADQLLQAYVIDEVMANTTYLDKVISVKGKIALMTDGETPTITLESTDPMSAVVCELANKEEAIGLEIGQEVTVKGQCTGYLSDVILVKCIIE